MKKHLNSLYITKENAVLNKEGETIIVKINNEKIMQIPSISIGNIVCFGGTYITPQLMGYCAENNIGISYLTVYGKFQAKVTGPASGNVLVRKQQYRFSDNEKKSAQIASYFIGSKLKNSGYVYQRHLRNYPDDPYKEQINDIIEKLKRLRNKLKGEKSLDIIRGIEGEAAKLYYSGFNYLIRNDKIAFHFNIRTKFPPLDKINSLLSFVYTLMTNDVKNAIETTSLDSYVGFLHRDRPGRPGLALDMVEEFRAVFCDRLVLSLINLKKINGDDFIETASKAILLKDDARKRILETYQQRKREEIIHPFLQEKTTIGLIPFLQAQLFNRFIRDDIDVYPPFIYK